MEKFWLESNGLDEIMTYYNKLVFVIKTKKKKPKSICSLTPVKA